MLKKLKLKNSTLSLIGIIIIGTGIAIGCYEYFEEEKDKTFSEMNILLYESESPQNIESDDEIENEIIDENEVNNSDETNEEQEQTTNNTSDTSYNYIGILEIPKINLKRGFLGLDSRYNSINYNITVINGSTFPNEQNNNLILAAHSGVCTICYFDKLYKLGLNDVAYIYYNNIKYEYKIVNIYEVTKDGTVEIRRDHTKGTLTLITCTRNSNTKQTVYILELQSEEKY